MNVKRELIALAVRALADNTSLVRKPDSFENFLHTFLNGETYDQTLARQLEADFDKAAAAVKRANTNRKFKKIIQNV